MRHAMLDSDIRRKIGGNESVAFTAFVSRLSGDRPPSPPILNMHDDNSPDACGCPTAKVASSTQHEELAPADTVDGRDVCASLLGVGFNRCVPDLVPYAAKAYTAPGTGLEFQR